MTALALRRGSVVSVEREGSTIELTVDLGGARRPAVALRELTGEVRAGDDIVVNVTAADLGLGSGGFDLVHVNLTRGLEEAAVPGEAMAFAYTPLQHTLTPIERTAGPLPADGSPLGRPLGRPVGVLALHGQLEPAAWAAARSAPGARIGYVQTVGGALPGALSRAVGELRGRGLLAGHITAGAPFGGEEEAVGVAGALHAGLTTLGWDAGIVGPGPGIVGSASLLGHGGLAALDSAHVALALGAGVVLVPRLSSGDPRPRHRGLSHHTATVLDLLLRRVEVALPHEYTERPAALLQHRLRPVATYLDTYRASGLSSHTMGRSIHEDELFFRAGLAGGHVLAEEITGV